MNEHSGLGCQNRREGDEAHSTNDLSIFSYVDKLEQIESFKDPREETNEWIVSLLCCSAMLMMIALMEHQLWFEWEYYWGDEYKN